MARGYTGDWPMDESLFGPTEVMLQVEAFSGYFPGVPSRGAHIGTALSMQEVHWALIHRPLPNSVSCLHSASRIAFTYP